MTPPLALVAEDSDDLRLVMRLALEETGWQVVEAVDGAEAVEVLETADPAPDLVLLDLRMPVLDGLGVLAWMDDNGWGSRVPVVVLTAWADHETARDITARGHRWLGKPFELPDLLELTEAARARAVDA